MEKYARERTQSSEEESEEPTAPAPDEELFVCSGPWNTLHSPTRSSHLEYELLYGSDPMNADVLIAACGADLGSMPVVIIRRMTRFQHAGAKRACSHEQACKHKHHPTYLLPPTLPRRRLRHEARRGGGGGCCCFHVPTSSPVPVFRTPCTARTAQAKWLKYNSRHHIATFYPADRPFKFYRTASLAWQRNPGQKHPERHRTLHTMS